MVCSMRHQALQQLRQLLQAAAHPAQAASGAIKTHVRPRRILCNSSVCCSALIGDQQLPWNSLLLQAFRSPFSSLPDTAVASSSHADQTTLDPKQPAQQQPAQQQEAPAQGPGHPAEAPLNFDDTPAAAKPLILEAQEDAAHTVETAPKPHDAQKPQRFKVPVEVVAALYDTDSSSSPSVSNLTSSSTSPMIPMITTDHETLAAWQVDPHPKYADLIQQDRLRLSGQGASGSAAGRAGFITVEAFTERAALVKKFSSKHILKLLAVQHGVQFPKKMFNPALESFRKFINRAGTAGFTATLLAAGTIIPGAPVLDPSAAAGVSYTPAVEELLLKYFADFCKHQFGQEIELYTAAVSTLDFRSPHSWYPYARAIKRKIIYHGGPTNSGKTYNALQSLAAAERGVYCAPLRLLAMEVYETLNHMGVYCDLVTGQEVLKVPGSAHVACTVEMAALNTHADVAVIDEIQLIGDDQRGFAWTRALLGLPANTIHVCGDTSAVALVRHLARTCGDDFELHTYNRMTPLSIDDKGLPNGWKDVQAGDAVVAFSRKNIYKASRAIEEATGQHTCIVYGALPAETRRHQARLFNDPHSDVNILVASDAIGLGLNFNIRRVIFTSLHKAGSMGRGMQPVPVSLVKQIAGRAGRRNSIYPEGCVTTLNRRDLPMLKKALDLPVERLTTSAAGLAPEYETVELLSAQFPDLSLEQLFRKLDAEARLDGKYFLCNQRQLLETAAVLSTVKGLSLQDQFTLVNAPLDVYDDRQRRAYLQFTNTYAAGRPVVFNEGLMPQGPPINEWQMNEAESLHKIMALWLWLSYRVDEGAFPGREKVQSLARTISQWLNIGLSNIKRTTLGRAAVSTSVKADPAAEATSSSGEEVDSSDADEVNQEVFKIPVVEELPPATDAAVDQAEAGAMLLSSSHDSRRPPVPEEQLRYSSAEKARMQAAVTYINWGSAVGSGLAHLSYAGDDSDSDDEAASRAQTATEFMSETSYAAGTSHSVETLEKLMMPEYEPGMGKFIRWTSRPRFVVPPAPRMRPHRHSRGSWGGERVAR